MTRVVNSRIRLLLLCILLAFGALLARAAWISTVRAASLSKIGQVQTKAPVVIPAARGTIFDSVGAPLALGEQATTSTSTRTRSQTPCGKRALPRTCSG